MLNPASMDAPADWHELWSIVSDALLGGLQHALNNRVAAVSALSQVLDADPDSSGVLIRALIDEVNRLEGVVALLGQLRRSRGLHPEPVELPKLVRELPELLRHHIHLREVHFAADGDRELIPIWGERDQLTRILLTLLLSAGIAAERSGSRRVRIEFQGDEDSVEVTVVPAEPGSGGSLDSSSSPRLLHPAAAGVAAAAQGGALQISQESANSLPHYVLRLPTLLAARRSEATD